MQQRSEEEVRKRTRKNENLEETVRGKCEDGVRAAEDVDCELSAKWRLRVDGAQEKGGT